MPSNALGEEGIQRIHEAVKFAENSTSGEIRICIEESCPTDVLDRAAFIFKKLGIHKTKERNGVLIYLSFQDKRYAIIGDSGIHKHVKQSFWDAVGMEMVSFFKQGKLAEGIIHAVNKSGEKLSGFFPRNDNDKNELSDQIYFGEPKNE